VLDTAHNPASARALVEALDELPQPTRSTLIVSISHDKDVTAVLRELVPCFQRIIVTQYQENPRAVPADILTLLVRQKLDASFLLPSGEGQREGDSYPNALSVAHSRRHRSVELQTCFTPQEAWQTAIQTVLPGERICIAGSFFLAAELRPLVFSTQAAENSVPEMRL
jgi:dihydrofolate synthase/folylpolyglutamate synthase